MDELNPLPGYDLLANPGCSENDQRIRVLDIAALKIEHLNAILAIYRLCEDFLVLGPQPEATLPMVQADLNQALIQNRLFCAIYFAGDLVGVVDFLPAGFGNHPNWALIELLMITPSFRNRGLGRRVVEAVEQIICCPENDPTGKQMVTAILLGVQVNNPAALRFWQRCGYHIISGPTPQPDTTVSYLLEKMCSANP